MEILQRCWVSPSMLLLLYLALTQEAVSSISFSQFIWTSRLPRGRASLASNYRTAGPSSSSPTGPSKWARPACTARFFGLKVEIAGTGPFPTSSSVPLRWRQERHSQAVELLWVETRNTEPSEASGRQLVHGVGVVPGAGASGCLPPPLRPVAILEPGEAHTFTGSAVAAERAGAQPRPAGRGEGQR